MTNLTAGQPMSPVLVALNTGAPAWAAGAMAVGDQIRRQLLAWDAGTEANDETATSIPGPAGGGEGFNPARSDSRPRRRYQRR